MMFSRRLVVRRSVCGMMWGGKVYGVLSMLLMWTVPPLVYGPARPVWQVLCLPYLFPRLALPLVSDGLADRMDLARVPEGVEGAGGSLYARFDSPPLLCVQLHVYFFKECPGTAREPGPLAGSVLVRYVGLVARPPSLYGTYDSKDLMFSLQNSGRAMAGETPRGWRQRRLLPAALF